MADEQERKRRPAKLGAPDRRKKFAALILRDGDQCHYCEIDLNSENRSLDHVVPRSQGGVNALFNLVLACKDCNNLRGDMDYDEFVAMRSWVVKPKERERRLTHRPFEGLAGVAQFG